MPVPQGSTLVRGSIPERDAKQYAAIYRYFPNLVFADP
jgi:hypothetical protein